MHHGLTVGEGEGEGSFSSSCPSGPVTTWEVPWSGNFSLLLLLLQKRSESEQYAHHYKAMHAVLLSAAPNSMLVHAMLTSRIVPMVSVPPEAYAEARAKTPDVVPPPDRDVQQVARL